MILRVWHLDILRYIQYLQLLSSSPSTWKRTMVTPMVGRNINTFWEDENPLPIRSVIYQTQNITFFQKKTSKTSSSQKKWLIKKTSLFTVSFNTISYAINKNTTKTSSPWPSPCFGSFAPRRHGLRPLLGSSPNAQRVGFLVLQMEIHSVRWVR